MGPEGIILVNPPITTLQQSLTHSAMNEKVKVAFSFKTVLISLKNGKFLIPTPHYNFCIVHW